MITNKKQKVEKFLEATREYIIGVDTPEEVRAHTGYQFIVALGDELAALGVPGSLACLGAVRVTALLPKDFHVEYKEEFIELVALWAKTISVTYETLAADYDESIVGEMFLQTCDKIKLDFSFS